MKFFLSSFHFMTMNQTHQSTSLQKIYFFLIQQPALLKSKVF